MRCFRVQVAALTLVHGWRHWVFGAFREFQRCGSRSLPLAALHELWPMLLFLTLAGAVALKRYRQTLD